MGGWTGRCKCQHWIFPVAGPTGNVGLTACVVREGLMDVTFSIRLKILSEAGFSLIPSGDDATPAKVLIRESDMLLIP